MKLNKVLKSQETQLNTQELKEQIQQVQTTQATIMARLEGIPDLKEQVAALRESKIFKDLGKALTPFTENKPAKPFKPQKQLSLPAWLKPKQVKPLDIFAGAMTFLVWIAVSGWLLSSFALSWGLVAGVASFWLVFVVVFRLVVGGLLD